MSDGEPFSRVADIAPRRYRPLEQADFLRLKHAPSLKGLLKPFKGKGEWEAWASECEALRDAVMILAQRMLAQASAYPFNLLPVVLTQQATGAGTTFLRWRMLDRSQMGVALWEALMTSPSTPTALMHDLYALEIERVALNCQVSLTHSIARQAR
ncbi:MAG: DUF3158 family protein, partial [Gammaproteobacteria bacterium]|nr:DUF3158 family protein [Gammaproteobacteria bacterium]